MRGVAVIYISHKLSEIFAIADRITVMRDGGKRSTRLVDEWTERELVSEMVGRRLSAFFPAVIPSMINTPRWKLAGGAGAFFGGINLIVQRGEILGIYGIVGSGRNGLSRQCWTVARDSVSIGINGSRHRPLAPVPLPAPWCWSPRTAGVWA